MQNVKYLYEEIVTLFWKNIASDGGVRISRVLIFKGKNNIAYYSMYIIDILGYIIEIAQNALNSIKFECSVGFYFHILYIARIECSFSISFWESALKLLGIFGEGNDML